MNLINKKIHDFLKYYCDLPHPPEYAVLIKGKWGTGKTWFIKKLIQDLNKSNIKTVHMSLYGMTNFDEIESEFFRMLHPFLASEKMALASKVLKGVLKASLKIDLGKDELSVSSSIPDIDLSKYLTEAENAVLIFDDVERCGIPICNLLGYINHFVEHGGHKVILLANEEEILEIDADNLSYKRVKEKLIGKTFEIAPEVESALNAFISLSSSIENRKILEDQKSLIANLYNASQYKNLRHLKQAIADFEWLLDAISEKAKTNNSVIKSLITTYLVLTFETKSGEMQISQIKELANEWINYFVADEKDKNNIVYKIGTKYPEFDINDLILNEELWMQIFDKGIFDVNEVFNMVEQSHHLFTENTPAWKKLWYASELDDAEIVNLLQQVDTEFKDKKHSELEVFFHIFGIFLKLSEVGIYLSSKAEILSAGKAYVDFLKETNMLASQINVIERPFFHNSAHNLGYHSKESAEFGEINQYVCLKCKEAVLESYPTKAIELLNLMCDDSFKFSIQLHLCNHEDNFYYNIPILKYIDVDSFVSNFIELTQRAKWNIGAMLEQRYAFEDFRKNLLEEKDWLLNVSSKLADEAAKVPNTMKNSNLSVASNSFAKAADQLEK
jgi:hypothetical protein